MSNKSVELLLSAVSKLQADVEWLKKGMMGVFASLGVGMVTLITTLLLRH